MKINLDQLKNFTKVATPAMVDAVNMATERFAINNERRIRYFMAQAYSETQGFTKFVENLYYTTPERIVAVWPTRFNHAGKGRGPLSASLYARNPQKLANEVYASRMGNGGPASNDGWSFIGRGAGHLTGRSNYTKYSQMLYGDDRLVKNPELVEGLECGFLTFAAFWDVNGLNGTADTDSFTQCTARINGASGATLTRVVNERLPNLKKANQSFVW